MNRMNRTANAIVLVTLVGCGGGNDPPIARPTAAGCVSGTERMTIVSGDGQTAPPGALLPERPTARATCESFASRGTTIPLAGAAGQWWVISGDGRINGATTVPTQLDADGTTSVAWTLPNNFGREQALRVALAAPNPPIGARFSATVASSATAAQSCQDAGGTEHGASTLIAAHAAWTAAGSPHRGGTMSLDNAAVLSIEAGAVVCVETIDRLGGSGSVLAEGTAQAPIRFFGTALRASSRLSHVQGEDVPVLGSEAHPTWSISDSSFRWTVQRNPADCAQVNIAAGGGILRTLIEGYGSQSCAALRLAGERSCDFYYCYSTVIGARIVGSLGDGVSVDGENDVSFTNCQVSSSTGHGIVVAATSTGQVTASGCNLFDNGGHAIANRSIDALAAPDNWWGDPAGPSGPNGDGTSGVVTATNPRAGPLTLGY